MPTTSECIDYGLSREEANVLLIEKVFNLNLKHSKYICQNFDWYDGVKKMVIEHKSFHLKYHNENVTLLKTNKICNRNSLFIFEFNYQNTFELFYLQYSSKVFSTFQVQYYKYANKIYTEQFFVIPNHLLVAFDKNSKIELVLKQKNNKIIDDLIFEDNQKYEKTKSNTFFYKKN